jgi:hypothetical protein
MTTGPVAHPGLATLPAPPGLDPDDEAVTRAHRHLPGNLDAGLMPGTELGGVRATAWREDGALQVDLLLDDADSVGVCRRCGSRADDGEGWAGLCGTCADQDYAAEQAAGDQEVTAAAPPAICHG